MLDCLLCSHILQYAENQDPFFLLAVQSKLSKAFVPPLFFHRQDLDADTVSIIEQGCHNIRHTRIICGRGKNIAAVCLRINHLVAALRLQIILISFRSHQCAYMTGRIHGFDHQRTDKNTRIHKLRLQILLSLAKHQSCRCLFGIGIEQSLFLRKIAAYKMNAFQLLIHQERLHFQIIHAVDDYNVLKRKAV